jgi:anti-sigma regulatory factor (Ser/Thr protein kinase)
MAEPRTPSRARAHQATSDAIEATVPAEPHAPASARAAVTRWLTDHVDDTVLHDARLLLSELITNCLRHADPEADTPIRFRAHLTETRLRLEVWDTRTSRSLRARAIVFDDDAGVALQLVQTLALRWGVKRIGGTRIWLELAHR